MRSNVLVSTAYSVTTNRYVNLTSIYVRLVKIIISQRLVSRFCENANQSTCRLRRCARQKLTSSIQVLSPPKKIRFRRSRTSYYFDCSISGKNICFMRITVYESVVLYKKWQGSSDFLMLFHVHEVSGVALIDQPVLKI